MNIMPYLNILLFVLVGFGAYLLGRTDEQMKCLKNYMDVGKELHEALNKLERTKVRWISVKDRLPDDNQYILVSINILFREPKVCLYYHDMFFCADEDVTKWVTHWMPLLEKPTGN